MSLSDSFDSPSMWPTRQRRRDAAIARDRARVEARFADLEKSVANIDAKIDRLLARTTCPPPGLPLVHDRNHDIDDIGTRLDRLEILLFRTSLPDFHMLDEKMTNMMAEVKPDCAVEPEAENTPEKPKVETDVVDPSIMPNALQFDIFSEISDDDPHIKMDHDMLVSDQLCLASSSRSIVNNDSSDVTEPTSVG